MKVIVTLELNIDPEQWDASYGTGASKQAITQDAKSWLVNHVQQSSAGEDGLILGVAAR